MIFCHCLSRSRKNVFPFASDQPRDLPTRDSLNHSWADDFCRSPNTTLGEADEEAVAVAAAAREFAEKMAELADVAPGLSRLLEGLTEVCCVFLTWKHHTVFTRFVLLSPVDAGFASFVRPSVWYFINLIGSGWFEPR